MTSPRLMRQHMRYTNEYPDKCTPYTEESLSGGVVILQYVLSQTKTKPKLVIRSGLTQLKSCAEGPKGKTIQLTNHTHLLRADMDAVKLTSFTEHSWCSGHTAPSPKPKIKPKLSARLSAVVRAQLKRLRVQGNNRRAVVFTMKNCSYDFSTVVFVLVRSRQSMQGRAIIRPK